MKKYVDHLSGIRYPDQVPDTLDLTDRAKLALNGLLMTVDPEHRFEQYPFANPSSDPPWLFHYKNSVDLIGKALESVAMMRIMSGDMSLSDIQDGILHYIFEDIGDDGLYYARALPERPWHEGGAYHNYQIWHQDFASVIGNARLMLALQAFMKISPDEQIAQALRRMAHGMSQIAIAKEDYAYYPDGGIGMAFCYPKTGWKDTTEPISDEWGGEGTVMCYYGSALRAFSKLADEMHDEEAFETAGRLANFCIKPRMWGTERVTYTRRDQKPMPIPGAPPIKLDNDPHHLTIAYEHAHFTGHFHGRLVGLRGILDYGMLTNDMAFKTFAQEGYEFAKHRGIPLTGSFGEHWWWGTTEGCTVADMTALAIRLTDAGLGDYWDDVDRYVRNQLIEQQYTDTHLLEAVSRADHSQDNPLIPQNKRFVENLSSPDQLTHDHVIDRIIGAYATFSEPTSLPHPYTIMCCTGNCTQALYYVWESMLREDGDTVHVNLLLNRASRMADVYSWLPQQGKAVIRNKAARTITVRIPAYVQKPEVRWLLPNQDAQVVWLGRYLVFSGVKPGEKIQIEFPVQTEKYHYTMPFNGEYSITMKGNTCIDISPRDTRPSSYPIYLRDNLKNPEVNMTSKERFVTDQMVFHW